LTCFSSGRKGDDDKKYLISGCRISVIIYGKLYMRSGRERERVKKIYIYLCLPCVVGGQIVELFHQKPNQIQGKEMFSN
jgi:hypothetical protein